MPKGISMSIGSQLGVVHMPQRQMMGLHRTRRDQHLVKVKLNTNVKASLSSDSKEATRSEEQLHKRRPLVKMCGITSARDAAMAAKGGADFIGMILSPNSKRSISISVAREISKAARENGAKPVGVFVDDSADTILRASEESNIEYVQLHGKGSRNAFPVLVKERRIMYVLHADSGGSLLNHISDEECSAVDWVLIDSATGGSGEGFDWSQFKLPTIASKNGWLLAGGISHENVQQALSILKPDGVDVSSGICTSDGIRKDPRRVSAFIDAVNSLHY